MPAAPPPLPAQAPARATPSPVRPPAAATDPAPSHARREALVALGYWALWVASLTLTLEGELAHWGTLVLLPLAALAWARRRRGEDGSPAAVLRDIGLRRAGWARGLAWAVPLGLALAALQLLVSRHKGALAALLASPRAILVVPAALALLLLTAPVTEEVFFRGVLQERLARWLRSERWAVVGATLAFALFHVPYAYLKPSWPSHGDLGAALSASLVQGGIAGLVLGAAYVRSGKNLLVPIVLHALINLLPAARWVDGRLS